MKKSSLLGLAFFVPFFIQSTISWHGTMLPGTANATDQDIEIMTDTVLPNEVVTVQAINRDVTIYSVNGPHRVYSSDQGQTTLVLEANYPFKIEIVAPDDLILAGVIGNLIRPLLIQERCTSNPLAGLIEWNIGSDAKIYFGDPDDANRGGALLQIVCNEAYAMPRHIFKLNHTQNATRPHIFFNRNSGLMLIQEVSSLLDPFVKQLVLDFSGADNSQKKISFKDGSGWFFEFFVD